MNYTAAQLARPLGVTPQAVLKRLSEIQPTGFVDVCHNTARTWAMHALPGDVRQELENMAQRQGYRDAAAMLTAQSNQGSPESGPDGKSYNHSALAQRLVFADPAKPTLAEKQNVLEYSYVHFQDLAADAPGREAEIKGSIIRFLCATAPALAASGAALKRTWYRKYARWIKNGRTPAAVVDGRAAPSEKAWMKELEPDLQLILKEGFEHDGKLAIAIRKLRRADKLSQAFIDRYTLDARRDKSYVARSVRNEIKARLTGLLDYRHSKWAVNMAGPRIEREHNYNPGDHFAADDVTFNIVFWYIDEHGQPAVTRGKVLLFFDCRSLYPLGYVLAHGRYNGETVRRAIVIVYDRHGLPHRAFIFEKGVWASRLLVGERPRDFLGWDQYEMGLRERGLRLELRNVTTPGAKLIEGLFNILQQGQRNERGFVGFNERSYGQEKLQTFIGRVKRGLVHPSTEFHSDVEWRDALDRSIEAYMHEPQNGKLLQGKSPAEMFSTHQPLRRLPDDARYLLASHRVRAKVKSNGITITIRGQRRSFYSKELGPFHGREVFAWFNIEQPDLLTISTLDGKRFFSVKRQVIPAFDATNEQLAAAHQARNGFLLPPKLLFDQIKHPTRRAITNDNVIDDDARALGAHIRHETEQFEAEQSEEKRALARLARSADAAGIPLRSNVRNPERVREAIEQERLLREEIERSGQEQSKP